MKEFKTAIATIPVNGKEGDFLQVKMRPLISLGNPFYACIEAAYVNEKTGNMAAKPFLYLIAEVFYCKAYGEHAPGVMDSESARWGEIGIQMFDDYASEYRNPYPVGDVFVLDPYITAQSILDKSVVFAEDFDMEGLVAAMLKATTQYATKGRRDIDYFIFFGNETIDKDDIEWRKKLERLPNTDVFRLEKTFVDAVPGCFFGVWHNEKLPNSRRDTFFTTIIEAPWENGCEEI